MSEAVTREKIEATAQRMIKSYSGWSEAYDWAQAHAAANVFRPGKEAAVAFWDAVSAEIKRVGRA